MNNKLRGDVKLSKNIEFDIKETEKFSLISLRLNGLLEPADLNSISLPNFAGNKGVVLSGRGPIWLYGFLIHYYHPTKFVAVYDPRLDGAVVVETHTNEFRVGDIIRLEE